MVKIPFLFLKYCVSVYVEVIMLTERTLQQISYKLEGFTMKKILAKTGIYSFMISLILLFVFMDRGYNITQPT